MLILDAHCDTIGKICDLGGSLEKNDFQLDLKSIHGGGYVQFFAAFIDKLKDKKTPFLRCMELIDCYFGEASRNKDLMAHCNSFEDIKNALKDKKVAAILTIEGGEAIEGSIEKLRFFYDLGVRAMTLCWNYDNELCGGIEKNNGGLTQFGKAVVSEMNSLGMLIDLSHCSEQTFWDVVERSKSPVCATHSNARAICNHKRNLTDEQIKAIIKTNGCIGINLYPPFVKGENCKIEDVLRHIEHILMLGGENSIGLGCDFDGVEFLPDGIKGAKNLPLLFDVMKGRGYADLLIKKLSSGNFLNLLEKIM